MTSLADVHRLAYSPREAATVLGISRAQIYNLLGEGRIEARKLGARTLITHDELMHYLASLPVRGGRPDEDA